MALANAQGHISLNSKSYVLIEESYEKRAQQPFSPRFATGDPSEGDNSFWQFLAQRGFTSEGQEKFDVTTKYKQSAGWDIRSGKPYLGKTIESVALTAALPTQLGLVAAGTAVLYDDFENPSAIETAKWNANATTGGLAALAGDARSQGGSMRAFSGINVANNTGAYNEVAPARSVGGTYVAGGQTYTMRPIIRLDTGMNTAGTWEFAVYTGSSAANRIHAAFGFLYGSTGGYILEISGSNMTVAKLIKSSYADIADALPNSTNDTVVKTFDGTGGTTAPTGGSATARYYKITRNSSGDFEVFEGASRGAFVSLGTVNDVTYNSARWVGFTTAVNHVTIAGANPSPDWGAATTTIDDIYLPSTSGVADAGVGSKFINYNNALYTCWYTGDTIFTQTTVKTGSLPSNQPTIIHVNARDIATWSRDGQPTANKNVFLAMTRAQVVRVYNSATQVLTQALTIYGTTVIPISSTVLVVAGMTAENNGIPAFEVITFNAEAWTIASQKVVTLDGNTQGMMVSSAALDSSGSLYLAMSDLSASYGIFPSRLFIISAADLIATKPTVTAMHTFSDFVIRGLYSLAGSVYLYGARIRGDDSYASILKYPSTVMYESTLAKSLYPATEAIKLNHGIMSVWKNVDNVLFSAMNDLSSWDPILQMDLSGNILEVASFNSKQFSYSSSNILAVAEWGGRFYLLNAQAGTIKRTGTSRGALGDDFTNCLLQLSDMGGNTSLINKTLSSVLVEVSSAMIASYPLTITVNGTTVGTLASTDSDPLRKEISISSELTASTFATKLYIAQGSTWTGYIKSVMLKFVPTQFKKKAWGFGIRATKRLKFGDGSHESRAPTTIFSDIEAAWASNIPVTFIDVDGTSYSVLVTDFKQKRPLLQMDRSSEQESFYFVELLQV